jgi:hypothetical protein
MSEHNKAIVRRLFTELWNNGNLSVADEVFAPNYAHDDPSTPDFGRGPDSEKREPPRRGLCDPETLSELSIALLSPTFI